MFGMRARDIPRFSPTPGVGWLSDDVEELLRILGGRDLEGIREPLEDLSGAIDRA